MKYKLTENTKVVENTKLYQIQRLLDGALGGWIESEANLSQEGNCWVYGNAQVYGNACVSNDARVYSNAWVYDNAQVFSNAQVFGNACVYDNAQVFGNAQVCGYARVYGNAWVYGSAQVYGNIQLKLGKLRSGKHHNRSNYLQLYINEIDYIYNIELQQFICPEDIKETLEETIGLALSSSKTQDIQYIDRFKALLQE